MRSSMVKEQRQAGRMAGADRERERCGRGRGTDSCGRGLRNVAMQGREMRP
jgi:hypothetical protein